MTGPFSARIRDGKKIVEYLGNRQYKKIHNVSARAFSKKILKERLDDLVTNKHYYHLHKIDNSIFLAATEYFHKLGAEWCNLPLTTLMISSPGEVYAGKKLDYTTDTLPIEISWFNNHKRIFLTESSQFYLELRLLTKDVNKVFSIYNSFRKEKADFSHLAEFQHIEFEGKMDFNNNVKTAISFLKYITKYLIRNNSDDLFYYLTKKEIKLLAKTFDNENIIELPLKEALKILYSETKNTAYKKFSLKNFGSWEEIKLTEILKGHVIITDFPVDEIPFYHNISKRDQDGDLVAQNADVILSGYREVIGSGVRISDSVVLAEKARAFNLPLKDYEPYLKTRRFKHYQKTAGFGFGWQRYVQWLLRLPYIWDATHIPRGQYLPKP